MNNVKNRNTNIELMRIVSIFSIMFLHMYRHASGGALFNSGLSLNHVFLVILGSWGLVGVFCFIIISSYFLLDSSGFKLNKLLNLLFCTSLYATIAYIFSRFYLKEALSVKEVVKAIFSPVFNNYWYITGYIVLYVLHPLMNAVIRKLTIRELKRIVAAGFVLFFVYKYIYVAAPIETIGLFLFIYFDVALYKRIQDQVDSSKIYLAGGLAAFFVVACGLLYMLLYGKFAIMKYIYSQSISKFSPFMLMIAFSAFHFVVKKKPSYNKAIGLVAKAVLPVYLIHESDYMISILWDHIFKLEVLYPKPYFIIAFIGIAAFIYIIGFTIDSCFKPVYIIAANNKVEDVFDFIEEKYNEKIKL